jgi:hypothetical protein
MMDARHDTARLAREIRSKIGKKNPALRADIIERAKRGESYASLSAEIDAFDRREKDRAAIARAEQSTRAEAPKQNTSTKGKPQAQQASAPRTRSVEVGLPQSQPTTERAKLPRTPYATIISQSKRWSDEAIYNVRETPPQGSNRKEMIEAAKKIQKDMLSILDILGVSGSDKQVP